MQEETKFLHRVSKGSRYNQIYIPREMENEFGVGDAVEVRLIERKPEIFVHKAKLTNFKEMLIKEIFKFLEKFKEIEQIFVVGSFLLEKTSYRDIDLVLLTKNEEYEEFDNKINEKISEEFNLKFHIISGEKNGLIEDLKFSPMMRSMFSHFTSNKKFEVPKERIIEKNNILLVLMAPEDLINYDLEDSRLYYNSLRKLFITERFLNNEEEDIVKAYEDIKKEIGDKLFEEIRKYEYISKKDKEKIRKVIAVKLKKLKRTINGKK